MTESNQSEAAKKKVSLQELMKQQLANKKNQSTSGNTMGSGSQATQKMKSQQTKKPSNTRRKMGV
jgi:hypothetical protein